MNTFFRICVYLCMGLLLFSLCLSYVQGTGAFPTHGGSGLQIDDTGTTLASTTDLATPNMNYLWLLVIGGIVAGLAVGFITRSIVPAGLFIFAGVFWASFINTHSILSYGNFLPVEFLTILTIATVFIFIAAVIGILTGSG